MRGSVLKRGGTWSSVLYLSRDAEGRKRQQWVRGLPTPREAERELTAALGRLDSGQFADPGRLTMGEYPDLWLTSARPSLAATTWTNDRAVLTRWVLPRIGRVRLGALTPARLNALYAELLEGRGRRWAVATCEVLAGARIPPSHQER